MGSYTTKLNLYKPDVDEVGWAATVNANMGVLDDSALTNAAHTITGAWTFSTHPLSLDHTQISNIGANTHAQIDTHLADTTIHFTEANIDHGSIAGLTDDDHTQYAHLLGRAGGQSLAGDTASGGHLTLVSTTHATKGRIKLGSSGHSWYDEDADELAIRGPVINVKTFGAIGDWQEVSDGAITASDNTLTSATGNFVSDDVGKTIFVPGAGVAGADLKTTIASFTSTTEVEITDAASTTVSGATIEWATDNTAAIQAALDSVGSFGGVVYFPAGIYSISDSIIISTVKTSLQGDGARASIIKIESGASNFTNDCQVYITADEITIEHLGFDGNADNNSSASTKDGCIWTSGGIDYLTVRNCLFINTQHTTIFLASTTTPNRYINIHHNHFENVGWRGIDARYVEESHFDDNTFISTGASCIILDSGTSPAIHFCRNSTINGNIATKAIAPTTILNGQTETGFFFHPGAGSQDIAIMGNTGIDNRNAGFDGIGGGNHLTNPAKRITVVGNTITLTGLYGIDVNVDSVVSENTIDRAESHGIAFAMDLGGTTTSAVITNNTIINADEGSNGNIGGIAIFSLVSGAIIDNVTITGNTVYDNRGTQRVDYGVSVDATNVTYTNMIIAHNVLKDIKTESVRLAGTASKFNDLQVSKNIEKTPIKTITDGDLTPSILGGEKFITANTGATTITFFDDGYNGQVVDILFGDANTTIDFTGTNLKGNSGADWSPVVGDSMRCIFDGTDWLCTVSRFTGAGAGDLLADGSVPLTADWDVGDFSLFMRHLWPTRVVDSAGSAGVLFQKARGSIGSEALVNADDTLLSINAFGHDDTDYRQAGNIKILAGPTPASGDMPGYYVLSLTPEGSTTPTEVLRITEAGNHGINTTDFGSGVKVIGIGNGTAPSGTPTGGGVLYSESGALKWKGSSGTITTLAAA